MAHLAYGFKPILGTIVASLRNHVQDGTLDARVVQSATTKLAEHHYKYDAELFPSLPSDYQWTMPGITAPESLAEALLWKMGKWQVYKSFAAYYSGTSSAPKKTDAVFYAFAKHLQSSKNPIYDQHALRALWAVDTTLTSQQAKICQSLLVKKDGNWKPYASGSRALDGYDLYVERIMALAAGGASLGDLDKLLMPLGQALKSNTKKLSDFFDLIGCNEGGTI